jgi:hypothetical protein
VRPIIFMTAPEKSSVPISKVMVKTSESV